MSLPDCPEPSLTTPYKSREPPRDSWRPVGVSQADVADSAS